MVENYLKLFILSLLFQLISNTKENCDCEYIIRSKYKKIGSLMKFENFNNFSQIQMCCFSDFSNIYINKIVLKPSVSLILDSSLNFDYFTTAPDYDYFEQYLGFSNIEIVFNFLAGFNLNLSSLFSTFKSKFNYQKTFISIYNSRFDPIGKCHTKLENKTGFFIK